jgi:deoxyribose-phosphate aldolase
MAVQSRDTLSRERAGELVRAWAGGNVGALGTVLGRVTAVDQVGIELRVDTLKRRSIKKASKLWALDLAIRMMDLTTLEGRDTRGKIRALAAKAMHPQPGDPSIPSVAALCVYPALIVDAKEALRGSSVKVASVATAFPSGQSFRDIKVAEVRAAVAAGADFIKTSTGKVQPAATLPVTLVMLEAIRDFEKATGRAVGMKPAGGIRVAKEAIQYLVVLYETLGPRWMTPDRFRFGASSLLNDVLMQIEKERTGAYQGPDHFTID